MNRMEQDFGARLRWWRGRRGVSQLELAGLANSSQRHVSFLESGRTRPSREIVLRLAAALDVPLRQQNSLLLAAGFAPAWRQSDLAAPELDKVNAALDFMLAQQEPFPALVVDRRWNLLRANRGATRLTAFLAGPDPAPPPPGPFNIAAWVMSGLRPLLVNWNEIALHLLRGVQADALADGTDETAALLRRLLAYPDAAALSQSPPPEEPQPPVLSMHIRKGDISLRLFTAIATLGTPQDVTLQEIRIESFFPTDERTEKLFRGWASRERQ